MKTCSICSLKLDENSKYNVLFVDKSGINKEICEECMVHFENITNSKKKDKFYNNAIFYFNSYNQTADKKVMTYLDKIVKDKSTVITETESSGWIVGMRAIAWVVFGGMTVGGVFILILSANISGFFIFLASILGAFVSVAGIMIFLDLADNVMQTNKNVLKIRRMLEESMEKEEPTRK